MNLSLFAIRDIKGDAFQTPWCMSTQGQALRAFADLANDKQTTVGQHPEDYVLYFIATFDVITGEITAEPHPKHMAAASDFVSLNAIPLKQVS